MRQSKQCIWNAISSNIHRNLSKQTHFLFFFLKGVSLTVLDEKQPRFPKIQKLLERFSCTNENYFDQSIYNKNNIGKLIVVNYF